MGVIALVLHLEALPWAAVALLAILGVRGQLRACREEVTDQVYDVVRYLDELAACGTWRRWSCRRAADVVGGIAQAEREHRQGALGEVF
jgi:hypothetical protein